MHGEYAAVGLDEAVRYTPGTVPFYVRQLGEAALDGNGMADERNLPDTIDKVVYHNSPSAKDEARPTVGDLLSKLDPLVAQEPNMVNAPRDQGGK